jgi:hypothetical protein
MTTRTHNSSQRDNRRNIAISMMLVALTFLFLAATQSSAVAESVITTIIPKNVLGTDDTYKGDTPFKTGGDKVVIEFSKPPIPKGAEIVKATLQLSCNNMMNYADGGVLVSDKDGTFGDRQFNRYTPGLQNPAQWTNDKKYSALDKWDGNNLYALDLTSSEGAREWHSKGAVTSKFRPRLILEYTVPDRPKVVQTEGVPATHSPKRFLPTHMEQAQLSSLPVTVDNVWSYAPVFYNDLVYLITYKEEKYYLQALLSPGGKPVWSIPLEKPGQHLLLSETGRLYIVGKEKIIVYQLNPNNARQAAKQVKRSDGLNPTLAPALGPDGSLYFVAGTEVYGLNPDLQELWKVTLGSIKTSRITVGPSGKFVYLLGKRGVAMSLLSIDARTGDVAHKPLPNSELLTPAENPALHAPVVLLHTDGTEKIYVAANSINEGGLTCFDNKASSENTIETCLVASEKNPWPLPGLFSQPSAGISEPVRPVEPVEPVEPVRPLYSVQVTGEEGKLMDIDWQNLSAEPIGKFPVENPKYLLNGGNLVVDQAGNIIVWDGADPKFYVGLAKEGKMAVLPFAEKHGITMGSRLLFGTDGTLYAADPAIANNRHLRAVFPQYTLSATLNGTITSPTHLRVIGTVAQNDAQNAETTLSARGSVFLGAGFTVQQGATFTVK